MTKYYERSVTRQYAKEWMHPWATAEASLGLMNSFFLIDHGMVTQYVDSDEAEKFHKYVKNITEKEFNEICDNYFEAINKKDKVGQFKALTIFDEMDNYSIGTEGMKRRLMRVRTSTHELAYMGDEQ